jgi:hypothetical protein
MLACGKRVNSYAVCESATEGMGALLTWSDMSDRVYECVLGDGDEGEQL